MKRKNASRTCKVNNDKTQTEKGRVLRMNRFKKGLSRVLLCLVLMNICCPAGIIFADEAEAQPFSENVLIWRNNFDEQGFTRDCTVKYNKTVYETVDEEHGKSIKFDSNGSDPSIAVQMNEPLSDGLYAIAMKFYAKKKQMYGYIDIRPSDSTAWNDPKNLSLVQWVPNGKLAPYQYIGNQGTRLDDSGYEYESYEWNRLVLWADFDRRKLTYMVNGTTLLETTLQAQTVDFNRLIIAFAKEYPGITYLDNIELWRVNDIVNSPVEGGNMPEYLTSRVVISAETPNTGNIFYSRKDWNFDVSFENAGETSEWDVEYRLCDEYGNVNWSLEEKVELQQKSVVKRNIKPDLEMFGLYEFQITATCGEYKSTFATKCSRANVPPEGFRNRRLSVQTGITYDVSTTRNYKAEEVFPLIALAGFGMIRDEFLWSQGEKQPGVYAHRPEYKAAVDWCAENDMEMLNILGNSNPALDIEGNDGRTVPLEGELIDHHLGFLDFWTSEMKQLHPKRYYETWNEFNLVRSDYTPEQYAVYLKENYKRIKKNDPQAVVVAMSTALTPLDWIERVLIALGPNPAQYMDVVSFHPYAHRQTPEEGDVGPNSKLLRELLDKYGCKDVEIWATELSWYDCIKVGVTDEKLQSLYAIRTIMMNDANDYFQRYNWYDFHNDGISESDSELNYGLVRNKGEAVPFAAKMAYLTIANYNALLGDANFVEELKANEDCYLYRYKTSKNTDMIAIGTIGDISRPTSLFVGCDKVTVYDVYGNPAELSTVNGIVSLPVSNETLFIEGDFSDRVYEVDAIFAVNEKSLKTPLNSDTELSVLKRTNLDVEVVLECSSDNITLAKQPSYSGNSGKVTVHTSAEGDGKLYISFVKNGKVYYKQGIDVEYLNSAIITNLDVSLYKNQLRRRVGKLTVESLRNDKAVSGYITITAPESLAKVLKPIEVKNIKPGEKKIITFNFPEITQNTILDEFRAEFTDSENQSSIFESDLKMPLITKAENQVKIDGVLSSGEWNYDAQMDVSGEKMVKMMTNYKGPTDLSAATYAMWDDEYFYFAAKVRDNDFCQEFEPVGAWEGDGIQLAFAETLTDKTGTEIGISISGNKTWVYCYSHNKDVANANKLMNAETASTRSGEYTVYEVKLAWKDLLGEGYKPEQGKTVAFSMLFNDNDNSGRRGWLEYGAGIGSGKSPSRYLEVPFTILNK